MKTQASRLLFGLLLTCAGVLAGRTANAFDLGVEALAVLPRGQLDDNVGDGYGVGLQFMVPLGKGPFSIGAEAAFATYADQRRELFDDLDVVTSNDIGSLNAVFRVQATSGRVRPYLDAVIGVKFFQTESSLELDDCSFCDDSTIDTDTELRDEAFAYGVGAGLQIELSESLFLDTRARYTRGRDATYLTRGSISDENLDERLRESRTDTVSFHLGLVLRF